MSVPVTTVPAPVIVNTRSTKRRVRASSGVGASRTSRSSAAIRSAKPVAVPGAHRHDRCVGEHGARDPLAHLVGRERDAVRVDQVGLRERDHAAGDPEHVEDLQVLLRLRLPALVGRDDEQHEPDGPDAGEHVADEPLVPGHVDEPDLAAARQRGPRVAEVDRESAALLLVEPIGVDPGERDDQRGLAVVDVAGRRDDAQRARQWVSPRRRGRRLRWRTGPRGRRGAPGRR